MLKLHQKIVLVIILLVSFIGVKQTFFFFYLKIKGVFRIFSKKSSFNKIHIFQPPSLIRQVLEFIRLGEKYTINLLQVINKFGFLRSLKPLLVKDLAIKIINESLTNKQEGVTIYKSKDLFN